MRVPYRNIYRYQIIGLHLRSGLILAQRIKRAWDYVVPMYIRMLTAEFPARRVHVLGVVCEVRHHPCSRQVTGSTKHQASPMQQTGSTMHQASPMQSCIIRTLVHMTLLPPFKAACRFQPGVQFHVWTTSFYF